MTSAEQNQQLVEHIFAELAKNNPVPFVDALADDLRWITPGNSVWSRTFHGKQAVLDDLLGPVRAQLVERVRLTLRRTIADADHVVVEAKGQATTKSGEPYDNDYCFIYRFSGGKIVEVVEYLDTQLASTRLEAPWA
jgi:ketosteroid isomerase-like protein